MNEDKIAKSLLRGRYCGNCVRRIILSENSIGCHYSENIREKFIIEKYDYCDGWMEDIFRGEGDLSISFNNKTYDLHNVHMDIGENNVDYEPDEISVVIKYGN
mgnify:CR=1 FL=1